MYLRFTTKNIDEETGLEKGIFSILNELYDSNELHDYEQKTIKEVFKEEECSSCCTKRYRLV